MIELFGVFQKLNETIYKKHLPYLKSFPVMFHQEVEILYVKSDNLSTYIDGSKITLHKGDLYIVFPFVFHGNDFSPSAADIIIADPNLNPYFSKIFKSMKPQKPYIRATQMQPSIPFLIEKIIDTDNVKYANEIINGYYTALLGEIFQHLVLLNVENVDTTIIHKLLLYCVDNYKNDINLEDISKNIHVSQSYITYIFRKKIGCNLREYINDLRVNHAKNLLTRSDMAVTEIMFECGYKNQSTFNKVFRERCKVTPTQFRREYNSR